MIQLLYFRDEDSESQKECDVPQICKKSGRGKTRPPRALGNFLIPSG